MDRKKIAYILIFVSCILFILNLSAFNFDNLKENNYFGVGSNLLLIWAMILVIRGINKREKK
jgi:hypothetical protein